MLGNNFMGVSTGGSVPGLGPYPSGDPAAIRAAAAALRRVAGTLGGAPQPSIGGWKSPAAARVRGQLSAAADLANGKAGEARACASSLDRAADDLESDQRAWRLAKWRLELDALRNLETS